MDEDELQEKLDEIAKRMHDDDPEWFINDYEWTIDDTLREIDENENIFTLNEEIEKLDALDDYEQKILIAAIEIWGYKYIDLDDLDNYNLYEEINDYYDLGHYWAIESGCYDLKKMGTLANYIDFESFGRDISFESDGGFSKYGWIEKC
jgi:hypothetical protein